MRVHQGPPGIGGFVIAMLAGGCAAPPVATSVIAVSGAPAAAGPYSQGIIAGQAIFSAGFTPRDPATNALVQGESTVQANRVFDNIEAVLRGAGATWTDVVKVNVYMTNLADFSKMNEVMAARLGGAKPARTTVGVAALPNGAQLEIDVIAVRSAPR